MEPQGRHRPQTGETSLLMVSHVLPDPLGSPAAMRAWRLFTDAERTCELTLIVQASEPFSLESWRRVRRRAACVEVLPAGPGAGRRLHEQVKSGRTARRAELVLATHPRLAPVIAELRARRRVVDFVGLDSQLQRSILPGRARSHWRALPQIRRARAALESDRRAAASIDLALVNTDANRRRLELAAPAVRLLPDAVDLDAYARLRSRRLRRGATVAVNQSAENAKNAENALGRDPASRPPRLALHADWTHPTAGWWRRWFHRRIESGLRKLIPGLEVRDTRPRPRLGIGGISPLETLLDADVVACPVPEPGLSTPLILQAMALGRPVLATAAALAEAPAAIREAARLARTERDWIAAAAETLHDSSVARTLGERSVRAVAACADLNVAMEGAEADGENLFAVSASIFEHQSRAPSPVRLAA